ncbi:S8 family serine peptidase [Agromyces atrinae]|uniref:S8 family serine peptidase n=1 Tax=Agromyces atrinae TaxID=592376 RepID=UPI001F59D5D0|nr:S8 family serine peptidase [Agromyces atrinae]MCI2957903.1 S8 family serine peptidase [Agromyces atrinae]
MRSRFETRSHAPRRREHPGGFRALAVAAGGAVLAVTALAGAALPAQAQPAGAGLIGAGITQPYTEFTDGRYIVVLADEPAAGYQGGVEGFSATAPEGDEQLDARRAPVQDYSSYLEDRQQEVADTVGAAVDESYTLTLNGFAADLDVAQATELSQQRDVIAVVPDEILQPTAVPSTEFLGLSGEGGVWDAVGGAESAGEGVVVGVLDTGIAPENASFAGDALGTAAGAGTPYLEGDEIVFDKADGGQFRGVCVEGEQFAADDCSTKIVGARYYVNGFGADRLGSADVGEYVSPRDGDGHGSHTASTAAGNHEVPTSIAGVDYGLISGVAPGAKIAAYKVCWSGPDPAVQTDDGCATSDLLAGIDQAVADGVDVINYSIGGGAASTTVSLTDQSFLYAAIAGVFVAASAGNDGPGSSTLDNASPWITTVAATTIPSYEATATFGDGTAVAGASITVDRSEGAEPVSGDLVRADLVANPAYDVGDSPLLCGPGSLDPALVTGKIVMCERGGYDRVAKSQTVADAGGIGMLLVNSTPGSIDTDEHSVPTVHLEDRYWETAYAYAGSEGATVTFTPGNDVAVTGYTPPVPQVAGFSSRGPVLADGSDILKPDIAAPGVSILAAGANAEGTEGTYKFLSGTSMAAPHIAGLAALYLGERPNATPAEVKSAMMTTAYDTLDGEGATVTDPFAQGAGHVDPTKFFEPGLLYLNGESDWWSYIQGVGYDVGADPIDASNLNLASIAIGDLTAPETITRTVTATQSGTFTAQPVEIAGINVAVEPAEITLAEGESASYSVTFTRTDAPLDEWATGSLDWTSGDTTVHSPIAVRPVTIVAPDSVAGTGVDGAVDVTVTPGGDGEIPLATSGLALGTLQADPTGVDTEHSGSGTPGDSFEYVIEVPEGVEFARFDLDAIDDTADLDLSVYQLNAEGTAAVAQWQSATGAADERVDIANPPAATYVAYVDVYSGSTAWDFRTFAVQPGAGEGGFTVDPAVLAGAQGEPVAYTASWTGLAADSSYLGLVHYGETGRSTVVSVVTGDAPAPNAPVNLAPPTISGTPAAGQTLTAEPGTWDVDGLVFTYQWQRDGAAIDGATSPSYAVTAADEGSSLTVVVTATKEGLPPGSATSAAVVVVYSAKLSLSLSTPVSLSFIPVKATVHVTTAGDVAGEKVTITVGKKSVEAVLDQNGRAKVTLPKVGSGFYQVKASFAGTDEVQSATSPSKLLVIIF